MNRVTTFTGEILLDIQENSNTSGVENSYYHDEIVGGTIVFVCVATAVVIGLKRLDRFKNNELSAGSLEERQEDISLFNLHQ